MPTNFGQALGGGLLMSNELMQAARSANSRAAFMDAETQGRLLRNEQMQDERAAVKSRSEMLNQISQSLPPEERMLFNADPSAYVKSMTEGYSLSPGQVRFRGASPQAGVQQAPSLVNVPVPGQPGVTQPTWLRPGETQGAAVGGPAMPEILNPAVQAAKLAVARAGKTDVNLAVNTAGSMWKSVADKVGETVAAKGAAAQDAIRTIESANQIRGAVDSGSVIAGPGATLRLQGAQVAQMLGFSGPDAVVNTRNTIQGLSKLALGGRAALKGQGQISDYEGKLLQKAETGNIEDLTIPEIRALADVADRAARLTIRQNRENVEKIKTDPDTGPIGRFLEVPEPPPYQGMPTIKSDADFEALPSGTTFIAPDGSRRRKP